MSKEDEERHGPYWVPREIPVIISGVTFAGSATESPLFRKGQRIKVIDEEGNERIVENLDDFFVRDVER